MKVNYKLLQDTGGNKMQNIQTLSIPENVQNSGIIPLSQWNKYFAYPCVGTLRQMIFYKKYGIEKCISRVGGRIV